MTSDPPDQQPWSMAAAMEPLPPLAPPVEAPLPTFVHGGIQTQPKKSWKLIAVLLIVALAAITLISLLVTHHL